MRYKTIANSLIILSIFIKVIVDFSIDPYSDTYNLIAKIALIPIIIGLIMLVFVAVKYPEEPKLFLFNKKQ